MQAQLLNPAGAALVRHIKWWQHCFFRCLNLASKKDGTFDILSKAQSIVLQGEKFLRVQKLTLLKNCLKFDACGDLCRSVGRNRMVGFLPRQLTSHH